VRLEPGGAVVAHRMLHELLVSALGTEVVGVRPRSVVAGVGSRDDDGEELPLDPRQLRGPEHDLAVELD
jgi:hypothetical protein